MICLGNICRSPLAEGILKSKVSKNITVDSAGTAAWHSGSLPDKRSIAIAKKHGIDLTDQRARQFLVEDFDRFDLIYVMDKSNYVNICRLAPNEEALKKVELILNESHSGKDLEVPDPYYGEDDGFENVFQMLDKACVEIKNKLENA